MKTFEESDIVEAPDRWKGWLVRAGCDTSDVSERLIVRLNNPVLLSLAKYHCAMSADDFFILLQSESQRLSRMRWKSFSRGVAGNITVIRQRQIALRKLGKPVFCWLLQERSVRQGSVCPLKKRLNAIPYTERERQFPMEEGKTDLGCIEIRIDCP